MTKSQAKERLACYRGPADDADPAFAEALALARQDPELRRWFADQQAFDAVVRGKLQAVPAPLGLKTRVLAGRKPVAAVSWWRWPVWLGAAAVLVASAVLLVRSRDNEFQAFRKEWVQYVSVDYQLQVHGATLTEALTAFAQAGWPAAFTVPVSLRGLEVEGGCLLHWRDHKVTLLCLATEGAGDVWLFVIDRAALPRIQAAPASVADRPTAAWQDQEFSYLLVGEQSLPAHP